MIAIQMQGEKRYIFLTIKKVLQRPHKDIQTYGHIPRYLFSLNIIINTCCLFHLNILKYTKISFSITQT